MFACPADPRRTIRRQVFHRCAEYKNLLSSHLPRANAAGEQCRLLRQRRSGGRGGLSALSAMSPRKLAWHAGMAWNLEHGFEGSAADRRAWVGGRGRGGFCCAAWSQITAPAAPVLQTSLAHSCNRPPLPPLSLPKTNPLPAP